MSFLNPDPKSARIAQLLRELEQKNEYIETLRSKLPTNRRGSQTIDRAVKDAHELLLEAFKSGQTGRDHMWQAVRMKRSAWQWAVAFLRCAGIVAQRDPSSRYEWQSGLQFLIQDRDRAFVLHQQTALALDSREDGYQLLRRMWVYGFLPQGGADIRSKAFVQAKGTSSGRGQGADVGRPGAAQRDVRGRSKGPGSR